MKSLKDGKKSDNESSLKPSNSKKNTLDLDKIKIDEAENECDDEKSKTLETSSNQFDETGTHKKKRKKNVESRDIWT